MSMIRVGMDSSDVICKERKDSIMEEKLSRVTFLFISVENTGEETLECLVVQEGAFGMQRIGVHGSAC